ncbi:hypothetical protein INT47_004158 [Mucor saturninus]|uniref:Uncharacterized protein n=1 Tax=Mucor saturninus TaxID=64648 RepID=A0A8H7USH1_9FUNG|nr:hypothetical protein INT47_004158 [Mucor saturninus]
MGPEERRHRAREMQAEAISADALEQMIETARTVSAGRSGYVVSSFSTSGCDMSWLSVFEVSFDPTFSSIPQNSPDSSALLTPTKQAPLAAPSNSSTEFDTLLSNNHKLRRQQYTFNKLEELTRFTH